ncbi:hypothetical protein Rctr197k_076 [Virus Rctr197k]|nr:hypothetical protein Rctr197k_076 [Virus Rctr197k]
MASVEACVTAILCPLGASLLGALNGIISAQVAFLQAEVIAIEVQLASLQVQLIPIQVTQGLANSALEAVRVVGNLVPVSVMAGCFSLGEMTAGLNSSLDTTVASVNRILNEANRTLSFTAELEELRDDINTTIEQLLAIQVAISECP